MSTFWFLFVGALVLIFALVVGWIDRWQDRPRGVSASDWQRVSEEKERDRVQRVMGKR